MNSTLKLLSFLVVLSLRLSSFLMCVHLSRLSWVTGTFQSSLMFSLAPLQDSVLGTPATLAFLDTQHCPPNSGRLPVAALVSPLCCSLETEGSWCAGRNIHSQSQESGLVDWSGRGYEDEWDVEASERNKTVDWGHCKVKRELFGGGSVDHV